MEPYDEKFAASLGAGRANAIRPPADYIGQDVRADVPQFTSLAMQHVISATQQSQEIVSRLYELRDRLFGPSAPTNSMAQGGEKVTASGFAEAYARQANDAANLLHTIDRLTSELSNRL